MSDIRLSLKSFIESNHAHLETIDESLDAFNIFSVLGVQYRETRHSNFLGWLFDPNDSHNQKDRFLIELIQLVSDVKANNYEQLKSYNSKDLKSTKVYRESVHNIDLLLVNTHAGFVICIENKIHADYSPHQLAKYYNFVEKQYNDIDTRIYLTLTPFESESHLNFSKGSKYTNINYGHIVQILKSHQPKLDNPTPSVRESINQYIAMIEKDLLHSSDEVKLAQKIYKEHRAAIDFIVRNKPNFRNFMSDIERLFNKGTFGEFQVIKNQHHSKIIRFLPISLLEKCTDERFQSWNGDQFFCLELIIHEDHIWIKWCFGNILRPSEELQVKKTRLIQAMRNFESLSKRSTNFELSDISATEPYPGVGFVNVCWYDTFLKQEKEFLDFFTDKFKKINHEIIQPWIVESKELNWD